MANYHLHQSVVSRSTGRSAVGAFCYISAEVGVDERTSTSFNFINKKNVEVTGFLIPSDAKGLFNDACDFWNQAELFEDEIAEKRFRGHKDPEKNKKSLDAKERYLNSAQTAYTTEASLPLELSFESAKELCEEFAREEFLSRGLGVSWAIHWEDGNPHVHYMASTRALTHQGFSPTKDRSFMSRDALKERRKSFEIISNRYLERDGHEARVDCRSYQDRGLKLEPTRHEGYKSQVRIRKGQASRIELDNQSTVNHNKEVVLKHPEEILKKLATEKVVFTENDIKKELIRYLGDDHQAFLETANYLLENSFPVEIGHFEGQKVYEGRWSSELKKEFEDHVREMTSRALPSLMKDQGLIPLGEKITGERVYTTREASEKEAYIFKTLSSIGSNKSLRVPSEKVDEVLMRDHNSKIQNSSEQSLAMKNLCDESGIANLIGRAGAGKTTLLKTVKEAYEESGYRVVGLTFQGSAAEIMESKIGCFSSTMDRFLWVVREKEKLLASLPGRTGVARVKALKTLESWEPYTLTSKDVIMVDEANMVPQHLWAGVLSAIESAGAKLITAGDPHQAKSHTGSDIYRGMIDQFGASEISKVYRQELSWQQESSALINRHDFALGLKEYYDQGHIKFLPTVEDTLTTLAKAYAHKAQESKSIIALAFTNREVDQLNAKIRSEYQALGLLTPSKDSSQNFIPGDRILFLKNDNQGRLVETLSAPDEDKTRGIKNGNLGTIRDIQGTMMTVQLDTDRIVRFSTEKYQNYKHGYAMTINKSEGGDWDYVYKLDSGKERANIATVAWTRHRKDVFSFVDQSKISNIEVLVKRSERSEQRAMVQDYQKILSPAQLGAQRTVLDFQKADGDIKDTLNQISTSSGENTRNLWSTYGSLKAQHKSLAQAIVLEWGIHSPFAQDLPYSRRQLEEIAGVRESLKQLYTSKTTAQLVAEYTALKEISPLTKNHNHPISPSLHHTSGTPIDINSKEMGLQKLAFEIVTHPNPSYLGSEGVPSQSLDVEAQSYLDSRAQNWYKSRLSPEKQNEFKKVASYMFAAKKAQETWRAFQSQTPSDGGLSSAGQDLLNQFKNLQVLRDEKAHSLLESYTETTSQFLTYFNVSESAFLNHGYGHQQRQKVDTYHQAPTVDLAKDLLKDISFEKTQNTHTTRYLLEEKGLSPINLETPSKSLPYQGPTWINTPLNFDRIQSDLQNKCQALAKDILPRLINKPLSIKGNTLSCGSFSMTLQGDKGGSWYRFSTGEGGGPLQLIEAATGKEGIEAFRWAHEWLGGKPQELVPRPHRLETERSVLKEDSWRPIFPVPSSALILKSQDHFSFKHKTHTLEDLYPYRSQQGELMGYVARYVHKETGAKETLPITYCKNVNGTAQWRMKGFGDPRPLYNAPALMNFPDKPVLVVEGEKTANAAMTLFPTHVVITWMGGVNGISKSDWSLLSNREVVLWPDNDAPGKEAMEKLQNQLQGRSHSVTLIKDLTLFPKKWDLADRLPEGITNSQLDQLLTKSSSQETQWKIEACRAGEKLYKTLTEINTHRLRDHTSEEVMKSHENCRMMAHIAERMAYETLQNKSTLDPNYLLFKAEKELSQHLKTIPQKGETYAEIYKLPQNQAQVLAHLELIETLKSGHPISEQTQTLHRTIVESPEIKSEMSSASQLQMARLMKEHSQKTGTLPSPQEQLQIKQQVYEQTQNIAKEQQIQRTLQQTQNQDRSR